MLVNLQNFLILTKVFRVVANFCFLDIVIYLVNVTFILEVSESNEDNTVNLEKIKSGDFISFRSLVICKFFKNLK